MFILKINTRNRGHSGIEPRITGETLKNSVVLPYTTTRMPGISPGNLCVTNLNQGLIPYVSP
ncbi:hypothetical protein KSZ88_15145 [Bacteroides thetaiotaomicron]|jgi:hypothetical protein|uniref:hypothetical protein n=1 Tax=Bacteroides thetaiotaomicron TaxID=818 RepID=UPI0018C8F9D2|nr:hypothetical protein [Bacteroides thetaiotaomicron]DAU41611.1 MAG TPA: hypothetical protein [Caudoviricetes sp.]MBG9236525.1 hypothetical protein [Bacteroides thetaiotaomicron]MBG9239429.1 hypothetical protein [Bacteroides thetaiotaomicron]MBU9008722.1 hypothetical protein [Bacteroides thetaiotaomicron]MBU9073659.1 hypothetical protein [Bacteroides thetaiotaomicron]